MKEYKDLIGKVIVAAAIVVAAWMIANAVTAAGGTIGSQIASALNNVAGQIN